MTRIEKWLIWGSTAVVTATGVTYGWMKYLLEPADEFAIVNHPLQPWVLKLHIVSAPFLIFAIGMITMRHIWPHFKSGWKRGRRSGIGSALFATPMVVSGYLLQALTSAEWLRVLGLVHLALGLVFAIAAGIHFVVIRRRRGVELGPAYPAPATKMAKRVSA